MVKQIVDPLCYSVEEAAVAVGISRSLAFKLIREKKLPSKRVGRRIVVLRHKLVEWLEQTEGSPEGQ